MTVNTTATPSERLAAYRSRHRIEIDASGDWTTCATDGLKVYAVRGRQWRHDQDQIERLAREAYAYTSEVDGDGLAEAKRASEIAREDAWTRGTLTFESHGHAVEVDLA